MVSFFVEKSSYHHYYNVRYGASLSPSLLCTISGENSSHTPLFQSRKAPAYTGNILNVRRIIFLISIPGNLGEGLQYMHRMYLCDMLICVGAFFM